MIIRHHETLFFKGIGIEARPEPGKIGDFHATEKSVVFDPTD
jgi:hypothetical protein